MWKPFGRGRPLPKRFALLYCRCFIEQTNAHVPNGSAHTQCTKPPYGSSSLQELWLIICTQRPWTRRAAPLARLIAAKWTGIYRPSRSPVRRKRRDVSFSRAHCSVHSERAPVLPSWAWPRGGALFYRGSPNAPLRLHHPHISSSHGGPARHRGQALCVFWNPGLRVCVCLCWRLSL